MGYYSKYIRDFYNTITTTKNNLLILKWAEVPPGWGDRIDRVKGLGSLMVVPRSHHQGWGGGHRGSFLESAQAGEQP